eukprot:m.108356 g.108356  ORF g.108356 m.108356 type:complete len:55 (-) comp13344_c2_seq1:833-997(-)
MIKHMEVFRIDSQPEWLITAGIDAAIRLWWVLNFDVFGRHGSDFIMYTGQPTRP